jgi:tetratricopeptide (TPR) repeat protein
VRQDLQSPNKNQDLPKEMTPTLDTTYQDVAVFISLALLALCTEVWVLKFWFDKGLNLATVAGIHLGVVVTLALWTSLHQHTGQGMQLAYLLTLFTAVLGPLGTAGTLITLGLYYWFKRSATPFSEWYESLFPDFEYAEIKKLYEKAVDEKKFHSRKNPVIPFIDVLKYGTIEQKQAMIVLLIKNHHGKFANVLRKALEDKDGSVRVLAAKGMTKIEQHFLDRNMELESRYKNNKISHSEFLKTQILNDDEYLYSGILDEIRASEVRERSNQACKKYLQDHPEDLDIRFLLGRILLRDGKSDQAVDWFEECIEMGFISPSIYAWYFECMYRMGQFKKLREKTALHFNEIKEFNQVFQPDVYEVIKSWAGQKNDSQQVPDAEIGAEEPDSQVFSIEMKSEKA